MPREIENLTQVGPLREKGSRLKRGGDLHRTCDQSH